MERGNKEKILEMIKDIEKKNSEMKQYLINLSIPSRNDLLKKIANEIFNNNTLLQELTSSEDQIISNQETEKLTTDFIIEGYIIKIRKDPHKKIILLKEFLDLFEEKIAEKDKAEILISKSKFPEKENFEIGKLYTQEYIQADYNTWEAGTEAIYFSSNKNGNFKDKLNEYLKDFLN